ncbi:tail fiber domain-containing protein [Chryseobacterium fluminis]|uniref:tail fiber domain-containing protein n=1 Tax=Chryseobacterium fluminis TaxID=2983606 RepID=UPI002253217F|nr:tail fiber domain-containing protein [Chryseobacterium sp. MMS21-Ot14]UZT97089.1 tail fiber domain-containing protein [Chryseobacterium sp. MMS21-Ot14]
MKKYLVPALLMLAISGNAQVGINNVIPRATLDISVVNSNTPANTDGLLIPRINSFPVTNPTADQNSMLVYLSLPTPAGSPFGANSPGYYYWNFPQLTWVPLNNSGSVWLINGNSSTVDGTNFLGTIDNTPLNFRINNERSGRISTIQTFFGYRSGNSDAGNNNAGIGDNALYANTTGNNNAAFGSSTLSNNTSGSENVAVGKNAMNQNTTASGNTAVGFEASYSNAVTGGNVSVGYQALRNNTTDSNTAIGYQALTGNVSGSANTAIGRGTLSASGNGSSNTAVGKESMQNNTSGENNSAVGIQSLRSNTTGNDNTASGAFALYSNTTGTNNSSYGINSMRSTITGSSNTGMGKEAMYNNTTGNGNVALGFASMYANMDGNDNVAVGTDAGRDNSSGSGNVAIGHDASRINTLGSWNVAVGNLALYNNINGNNNTALGNSADVTAANISNATAIGNGAKVNISNKVRIGNENVTVIEGQVAMSVASDRRYKEKIAPIPLGLDFINQLEPVEYIKKNDPEKRMEWGLIAQDLENTLGKNNYKNAAIINNGRSDNDFLSVRYNDLFAPIIRSIQELSESDKKNEKLEKIISEQELKIMDLHSKLDMLEKRINELTASGIR